MTDSGMQQSTSRDLLCVTPQDEGYLSPSEEDLKRSLARGFGGGYLTCKPSSSLQLYRNEKTSSESEEEEIPWEELVKIPYTIDEHNSWDRLLPPIPFCFQEEHMSCLRQLRKSPSTLYISDDTRNYAVHTDNIWRSIGPLPNIKQSVVVSFGKGHLHGQEALRQIQSQSCEPLTVSTAQFVQHILQLVCGRESTSFTRVPGEWDRHKFAKNRRVVVAGISPGMLANLSDPYLKAGRTYKRLTYVSALHYDEKLMEREGFGANAVITAFLKFISDYLMLYQTSLMLTSTKISTFTGLNVFYRPFGQQLAVLEKMLDLYLSTDQMTLLKGLNTMMLACHPQHVADLLRSAFVACASAYLGYVADWIFRGALSRGFHIQRTTAVDYMDRRYWVKQFTQNTAVPKFLESSLNIIFETGKAINLLNVIRNSEPRTCFLANILPDEATVIRSAMEFHEVTQLANEWKIKLESFFAEHSFLEDSIKAAVATEDKLEAIDFNAIEAGKKLLEARRTETQRQLLDKKIEKQKYWHDMLTKQLEEKKDLEKQAVEEDRIENLKRKAYIDKLDQRHLDEETRLMEKHFGERIKETVGLRNVRERIAITKNNTYAEIGVMDICQVSNEWEPLQDIEVAAGIDKAIGSSDDDSVMVTEIPTGDADQDEVSSLVEENFEENQLPPENNSLVTSSETERGDSMEQEDDEYKNKFDPRKVRCRSVVPYNLDLELQLSDFTVLPQPLAKLNTSFHETENEDSSLRHDSLFLNYFFEQSAIIPVEAQNRMVNSSLLYYFITEKKLFQHMETLNKYLCLQNGLFGHFLTKLFLQEVNSKTLLKKEHIPRKATRLNEILREAVALSSDGFDKLETTDNLAFILAREGNQSFADVDAPKQPKIKSLTTKYDVLDNLTLNYSLEWPLNILLTEELLINYEKLFTFLMKLYRAEFLLLEIFSLLKTKGKGKASIQLSILHQYRYRMLHFVRSVRHYVNVTVIDSAWTELVANFDKMNSLDKVYEGLVRHIKFVSTNCLLGVKGEGVKKLLVDQLTVIECFCEDVEASSQGIDWDAGADLSSRQFARLSQKFKAWQEIQKVFLQVFFKLAEKGIYQKVSYFLQLFNFNEYFECGGSLDTSSSN